MNFPELDAIRADRADCPSDFDLDRLHTGELVGTAADTVRAHVDGCAACGAQMAMRAARFDALPDVDPRRIMDAVQRRMETPEPVASRVRTWWRGIIGVLALGGAVTAAILVMQRPPPDPTRSLDPGIRLKGQIRLDLHRPSGSGSVALENGATIAPGTPIKFVVTLAEPGRIQVIGQESNGTLYPAWPLDGQPDQMAAGAQQILPGAVQLDEALGREIFHLVQCPTAVKRIECSLKSGQLQCPEGCAHTAFALVKAR